MGAKQLLDLPDPNDRNGSKTDIRVPQVTRG